MITRAVWRASYLLQYREVPSPDLLSSHLYLSCQSQSMDNHFRSSGRPYPLSSDTMQCGSLGLVHKALSPLTTICQVVKKPGQGPSPFGICRAIECQLSRPRQGLVCFCTNTNQTRASLLWRGHHHLKVQTPAPPASSVVR